MLAQQWAGGKWTSLKFVPCWDRYTTKASAEERNSSTEAVKNCPFFAAWKKIKLDSVSAKEMTSYRYKRFKIRMPCFWSKVVQVYSNITCINVYINRQKEQAWNKEKLLGGASSWWEGMAALRHKCKVWKRQLWDSWGLCYNQTERRATKKKPNQRLTVWGANI